MPLQLADVLGPPEGIDQEYLWTLNFGPQHPATHTTLRTIFAELMRIHDHTLCCAAAALDLGAITAFFYLFVEREKIYDISEAAAGQRFHPSYLRLGGLLRDVDDHWVDMVRSFVKNFPKPFADVVRLLNRNRIFI